MVGDNPPYHAPTFGLTHYDRDPIEMLGGTTFQFVASGIDGALRLARDAAGGKDVKIGGGLVLKIESMLGRGAGESAFGLTQESENAILRLSAGYEFE